MLNKCVMAALEVYYSIQSHIVWSTWSQGGHILSAVPQHLTVHYQPWLRCCGRCKCKMHSQQAADLLCMAQDSLVCLLTVLQTRTLTRHCLLPGECQLWPERASAGGTTWVLLLMNHLKSIWSAAGKDTLLPAHAQSFCDATASTYPFEEGHGQQLASDGADAPWHEMEVTSSEARSGEGGQPTSLWFPPPRPHTLEGDHPSLPPLQRPLQHGGWAASLPCAGHRGTRGPHTPPPNLRRSSPRSWSHHWTWSHTYGENGQGQRCLIRAIQQWAVPTCTGTSGKRSCKSFVLLFYSETSSTHWTQCYWQCHYYVHSV